MINLLSIEKGSPKETNVQPVRRRIIEILKENGTATVAELANQLEMAQVSVRHHLDILMGEGLVSCPGVRRHNGAGRPSQVYELTTSAMKLFPQRHQALANGMLTELKALLPTEQVRDLFRRLAEKTSREAPGTVPGQSLEARVAQIAEFLTEKGYVARWEAKDNGYELHVCNCPYAGVSEQHAELCLMDQAMMEHLIPGTIRIESHALDGTSRCTYVISFSPTDTPET
jgi:predicted ArsR family transcriptional regulator